MPRTIISDTSCFIILSNVGEMDLLKKLYGIDYTTQEVAVEFGEPLPEWVEILPVEDKLSQKILEMQVDKGEASALVLAMKLPDSLLILDDLKARRLAKKLGLQITGTIGVLIKSKRLGYLSSLKPAIKKMQDLKFRISDEIIEQALLEAGENL